MELASLDPDRGLTLMFRYWEEGRNLDEAVRRAFGITLSGFEKEFQRRTRHRYGALALFADLTLVFFVLGVIMLPLILARRSRGRRRLRELLAADAAAERAEQESILALLLAAGASGGTGAGPPDEPPEPSRTPAPDPSADPSTDDGESA
jgi:hypothetical protein